MRHIKNAVLCAAFVLLFCVPASAQELSGAMALTAASRMDLAEGVFDGDDFSPVTLPDGSWIRIQNPGGIGTLYLIFDMEYPGFTLTDDITGQRAVLETGNLLHVCVDLGTVFEKAPSSVTLSLNAGPAQLNEIHCFAPGQVPDWVQKWEPPAEKADLLLLPAHGDDEQLFFAGVLPYYAGERGLAVQVAYLTGHLNFGTLRRHEMLNGLWAVGVRHYPVFGPFPDERTMSLNAAYEWYQNQGISDDELLEYVVSLLRRFRPDVAVSHDVNGEYGHGMHRLYTDLLCKAVKLSSDGEAFPESAKQFGLWDVPKTYLHLYSENSITLDLDQPLVNFGGMTAYQVTRDLGFPAHKSQVPYYAWYYEGADTAAQVEQYTPCRYGLYRTTVGPDSACNDFFENIVQPVQPAVPESTEIIPAASFQPLPSAEIPPPTLTPEKTWLLIPAVGTAILTALSAWQSREERKNKK